MKPSWCVGLSDGDGFLRRLERRLRAMKPQSTTLPQANFPTRLGN